MLNDLESLIRKETIFAIKSILEGNLDLSAEEQERERQRQVARGVETRGVIASADSSDKTDEAEDEEEKKSSEEKSDKKEKTPQKDRTGGKGTADSPKLKTPKSKLLKEPTVGALIDKLNALRGGRSLKDPEVKKSFNQYLEGLTMQERQSLLVFLTGIAQILAGTEEGTAALDPGDVGLRVKGEIETPETEKKEKKERPGREGTEENPIVVGEHQDKRRILRVLAEYRKHM
jgi:hypothetical protein